MLHWLKSIIMNIRDKQVFIWAAKLTKSGDYRIIGTIFHGSFILLFTINQIFLQ
jgi:hypothetical protein